MALTKIEWTEMSWNPTKGCSPVSPGCAHCYAILQALPQAAPGQAYAGLVASAPGRPRWTGVVRLDEEVLLLPLKWRKPRIVFVNSMSDLFHESLFEGN